MQADQTVLSLRPGRGNRGRRPTIRLQRPHGAVPAASFKAGDEGHERVQYMRDQLLLLRQAGDKGHERVQYTRDQLLQLRQVIDAPEDILKIIEEIAVDVFGEDQSCGLGDASRISRLAPPVTMNKKVGCSPIVRFEVEVGTIVQRPSTARSSPASGASGTTPPEAPTELANEGQSSVPPMLEGEQDFEDPPSTPRRDNPVNQYL